MSGVTFTSLYVLENNENAPLLTLDVEAVGGAEDRGLGVQGAGVLAPVTPPDWSTLVIRPPITAQVATLDQSEASTLAVSTNPSSPESPHSQGDALAPGSRGHSQPGVLQHLEGVGGDHLTNHRSVFSLHQSEISIAHSLT